MLETRRQGCVAVCGVTFPLDLVKTHVICAWGMMREMVRLIARA